MKHLTDRKAPTSEHWDRSYAGDDGKWIHPKDGQLERLNDAMELIGDVAGKSVLDLGGGPLLVKSLFAGGANRVVLVDHSAVACDLARRINQCVDAVVADICKFLFGEQEQFDVCVAMGIFEYLPPDALDLVFSRVRAEALVVYVPVEESCLTYEDRVTVHSRRDVTKAADRHGWSMGKVMPSREQLFARYNKDRFYYPHV